MQFQAQEPISVQQFNPGDVLQNQLPESLIIIQKKANNSHKQSPTTNTLFNQTQYKNTPLQTAYNFSESRQKLQKLSKEQQYLSQTFKIDNFYNEHKLNIETLKNKINEIKPRRNRLNDTQTITNLKNQFANNTRYQNSFAVNNKESLIPLHKRINRIQGNNSHQKHNSYYQIDRVNSHRCNNYSTIAQKSTGRSNDKNYQKNTDTINQNNKKGLQYIALPNKKLQKRQNTSQSTNIPKIHSIGGRYKQHNPQIKNKQKSKQFRKTKNGYIFQNLSNHHNSSQSSNSNNFINSRLAPIIKKNIVKITISEKQELKQFQKNIGNIWSLYNTMSQIVIYLSPSQGQKLSKDQTQLISPKFMEILLVYKKSVCSNKFEFLMPIFKESIQSRQVKALIQSRLLQNLSIVYIYFHIAERFLQGNNIEIREKNKRKIEISHLVNFVGICSQNLLLLIRVITLTHDISNSLNLSDELCEIFQAIQTFQKQSFSQEIKSIKDAIIRIQHNNQLTLIIQSKLNYQLKDKQLHKKCIGQFLRGVIIERLRGYYKNIRNNQIQFQNQSSNKNKPLFQYSFYIFQYLAYHLHSEGCIGLFSQQIETAPSPYLPLSQFPCQNNQIKEFSVVINPKNVLIYESNKTNKIYIRAHTQYFIKNIAEKCNIIFWADQMPHEIDSYLDTLTMNNKIKVYRLYRHHCIYSIKSHHAKNKKKFKYRNKQEEDNLVMIKDISRIPLPSNKYLIIDHSFQSYLVHQQQHLINMSWNGMPWDNGMKILSDYLQPLFREGINLSLGINLMRTRLEASLKTDRNKNCVEKKQKKK